MAQWIYDRPPASKSRVGGNPTNKAFTPSIQTFVREVLQNAKDARTDHARENNLAAEVDFELIRLTGERARECMGALGWDSLSPHLSSAVEEDGDGTLAETLKRFEEQSSIVLLRIEDRNTVGLYGPEEAEDNDPGTFVLLCKDDLYSGKDSDSAGGSHGAGKAVLWRYSGINTVYFNSTLGKGERRDESPRLIGRTSLPWHKVDDQAFDGDGYFGLEDENDTGRFATSVWNGKAEKITRNTPLHRSGERPGTTILIPGFTEPADEDRSLKEMAEKIRQAAAEWFWPSMTGSQPRLWVSVEVTEDGDTTYQEQVDPREFGSVIPFLNAEEAYNDGGADNKLVHPGDVAVRSVEVDVPPRKDGEFDEQTAEADLVVRMADESKDEEKKHRDDVAYYRGAEMIVKYRNPRRLGLSTHPFHAYLVCGLARGNQVSDRALEHFLRAAEPPEHTDWESTENLKNGYKQPYRKALDRLDQRVRDELRDLVTDSGQNSTKRGPLRLRKRFPLGSTPGGGGGSSFASIDQFVARAKEDMLKLRGAIQANARSPEVWKSRIEFHLAHEDSRKREETPLSSFDIEDEEVNYKYRKGDNKVTMTVPAGTRKVKFTGVVDTAGVAVDPDLVSVETTVIGSEIEE